MAAILFIMGVSGSGKTTIGTELSKQTGIPFFDGDDFHPAANKEKMSKGVPLNDDDRAGWLEKLNDLAIVQSADSGAIIACSALKEKYRQTLSSGIQSKFYWIMLNGNFDLIKHRLHERKGHFMPETLLHSQFDTLEAPANAIEVDITQTPAEIINQIRKETSI